MSSSPFHKRYHSDALSGMMPLTLEERGAYQTLLDLIYDRGGPIVDNERLISGYMNCSTRKYRSLRDSLIKNGKIYYDENDNICNARALKEIVHAEFNSRKRAEHGAKGGRKSGEVRKKVNKNNENDEAKLKPPPKHIRSQKLDTPNGDDPEVEPETLAKQIWDKGTEYLKSTGLGDRQSRSIIGMWRKERGDAQTLQIILDCQARGISDPVAYERGIKKSDNSLVDARQEFLDRKYG